MSVSSLFFSQLEKTSVISVSIAHHIIRTSESSLNPFSPGRFPLVIIMHWHTTDICSLAFDYLQSPHPSSPLYPPLTPPSIPPPQFVCPSDDSQNASTEVKPPTNSQNRFTFSLFRLCVSETRREIRGIRESSNGNSCDGERGRKLRILRFSRLSRGGNFHNL